MFKAARHGIVGAAVLVTAALVASGCTSNGATTPSPTAGPSSAVPDSTPTGAANSMPATSGNGASGLHEPDTNGDGKVVIGILSPGDLHDHGFYEGFVDSANAYAKKQGWHVIERGNVPDGQALNAARALCQQHVDMVALGAGELAGAIPAASEAVCKGTAWYVPSSANIKVTPRIFVSSDNPDQDSLASGYAAGLLMKPKGITKAGYVTGQKADFSIAYANGFLAGMRMVVPKATLIRTYTGDFNDSAKAKEAVQAQLSQGAQVIYPYLGGATDAAAKLADQHGAITLTPGTNRCASTNPKYNISVIFNPGDYFEAALELFAKDKLKMGTEKVWQMGVDKFPTVKMCDASPQVKHKVADFIKKIGAKEVDPKAEIKKLG